MKKIISLFIALILLLPGCAPVGFVETTANVIDEMTAFRDARRQNTREAWEEFIRQFPDSRKAQKARQWVALLPQESRYSYDDEAEQRRLEQERLERLEREAEVQRLAQQQLQQALEEEARRQEEMKRLQEAQPLKEQLPSQETAALMEQVRKQNEEIEKLKLLLAQLSQSPAPISSDENIDIVPQGGLPPNEENFALVIGIEKYRDIESPADYAERDAHTVRNYLHKYLGFPEQNIKYLRGDRATGPDLSVALEQWLPLFVTEKSKVFIYYSGHGAPDHNSQKAYILPYNADPRTLELTAYPLDKLYTQLAKLPAKEIIVAVDSCFSGAGGRSVIPEGARPLMTRIETGSVPSRSNMIVFTAASGDQITGGYKGQEHGLFTYYLLRGLRGDADANSDGWVSVQEEYEYLKKNVGIMAKRDFRDQTPQLLPDLVTLGTKANTPISKTK
jgi:hypothetical protein